MAKSQLSRTQFDRTSGADGSSESRTFSIPFFFYFYYILAKRWVGGWEGREECYLKYLRHIFLRPRGGRTAWVAWGLEKREEKFSSVKRMVKYKIV